MKKILYCLVYCSVIAFSGYIQAVTPEECVNPTKEINALCYPDNLQTAVNEAIARKIPLHLYPGTYRLTTPLIIDYTPARTTGLLLISDGAIIDARSITDSAPAIQVICSGGQPKAETGCFYFKQQGTLFLNVRKPGYAMSIGLPNYADAHNSIKVDHLIINNGSSASTASGLQLNYVLNAEIFTVSVSGGGGHGITLRQTQFSQIGGAASAATGTAIVFEGGYSFSNTIQPLDLEVAQTCLGIFSSNANNNTFVSPYFNCPTPVNATAGNNNILINPIWGQAKKPSSKVLKGIKII